MYTMPDMQYTYMRLKSQVHSRDLSKPREGVSSGNLEFVSPFINPYKAVSILQVLTAHAPHNFRIFLKYRGAFVFQS